MLPDGSAVTQTLFAFGIAMIAAEYMLVFINSMLPSFEEETDLGSLSGSAFALGYAGGVLALFLILALVAERPDSGKTLIGMDPLFGLDPTKREGTRSVGPIAAIWFIIFMIPFFAWVKDRDVKAQAQRVTAGQSIVQLWSSIRGVAQKPSLFAYLGSSMLYRDALNAIYVFGGVYAALVLDWDIITRGVFGIVAAISAAGFTWLGGRADQRFGPKPVIVFNVWALILVIFVIVGMNREMFFGLPLTEEPVLTLPMVGGLATADAVMFLLGMAIGGAGGALQGASRTMMALHADPERPTEAFGLYAFSGKATAFLAPLLIGIATAMSESARLGMTPIILLFIIALFLLRWVHPDGQRGSAEWEGSS